MIYRHVYTKCAAASCIHNFLFTSGVRRLHMCILIYMYTSEGVAEVRERSSEFVLQVFFVGLFYLSYIYTGFRSLFL